MLTLPGSLSCPVYYNTSRVLFNAAEMKDPKAEGIGSAGHGFGRADRRKDAARKGGRIGKRLCDGR